MTTNKRPSSPDRRTAYSAGGAIYKRGDRGVEVALIATNRSTRWGLPKGHVRRGESAEDAAIREIAEETGLKGSVEQHLATIDYWFRADGTRIHKYVDFFLVRYLDGMLQPQQAEVDDVRWFPLDQARTLASFEREREILAQVTAILQSAPGQ